MEKVYRSNLKRLGILVEKNGKIEHVDFHPVYVSTGVFGSEYVSADADEQKAIESSARFSSEKSHGLYWLHDVRGAVETSIEESEDDPIVEPVKRTRKKKEA